MMSLHFSNDSRREYRLPSAAASMALGAQLARVLPCEPQPAAVIYLEGALGAGKTTLVRGLLRHFNALETVKSPTYTLLEVHVISGLHFYHFDFYRFRTSEEFLDAGLDEYFAKPGVCLVEWPGQAAPYLPQPDLVVRLEDVGSGRQAVVEACSERGRAWLALLPAVPGLPASSA